MLVVCDFHSIKLTSRILTNLYISNYTKCSYGLALSLRMLLLSSSTKRISEWTYVFVNTHFVSLHVFVSLLWLWRYLGHDAQIFITCVPRSIYYATQYFFLESLYHFNIWLLCTAPQFYAITSRGRFGNHSSVCISWFFFSTDNSNLRSSCQ